MAQYLVLIYEDEKSYETADEATFNRVMEAHNTFGATHGASLRGGNALEPSATATSIRKNAAGDVTITDGPFAETKEGLGGFYLIEADDLDSALAIARDVPAEFGGVEVRPIRIFD